MQRRKTQQAPRRRRKDTDEGNSEDEEYFDAYAQLDIHEDMLKDAVRTETYREAIRRHADDFKDAVVLDVGCGTGILSHFAVEAGARKVYAVDASGMAEYARKIVEENDRSDKITVIQSKVEAVDLPEKVDIILSEWMGYLLYYESMFQSVLHARDKFLKPEGLMFPSQANLYLAPLRDDDYYQDKVGFWDDVYGVKMTSLKPYAKKAAFEEVLVEFVHGENMISTPVRISSENCRTTTADRVEDIESEFTFTINVSGHLHGFCSYFDVVFDGSMPRPFGAPPLCLTTAPWVDASGDYQYTHWAQQLMMLKEPQVVKQDDVVTGNISIKRDREMNRHVNVVIEYKVNGGPAHLVQYWL